MIRVSTKKRNYPKISVTKAKPFPRSIEGRTKGESGIQFGLSVDKPKKNPSLKVDATKKSYPKLKVTSPKSNALIKVVSKPQRQLKPVSKQEQQAFDKKQSSTDYSKWR